VTITVPAVLRSQFVRFAAVGMANTALSLAVYLAFRTVVSATTANLLATLLTTIAGTSANGKVTFGSTVHMRHHVKSMAVTGLGIVITTGAVDMLGTGAGQLAEAAVLIAASAVAGIVRFVLMRHWVFAAPGNPLPMPVGAYVRSQLLSGGSVATAGSGHPGRP
jgi:putative flippase GtrA